MCAEFHQTQEMELQREAASVLASLKKSEYLLENSHLIPRNLYHPLMERPFFHALTVIMWEIFDVLAYKPLILHSATRTNYAWNLLFKSWCPICNRAHSQQHWTIFQYHNANPKDSVQWVMCFSQPKRKIQVSGLPFYDELENKKDY